MQCKTSHDYLRPESGNEGSSADIDRSASFIRLPADERKRSESRSDNPPIWPFEGCIPLWRVGVGVGLIGLSTDLFVWTVRRENGWLALGCWLLFVIGSFI
jgi:hypothetical protein